MRSSSFLAPPAVGYTASPTHILQLTHTHTHTHTVLEHTAHKQHPESHAGLGLLPLRSPVRHVLSSPQAPGVHSGHTDTCSPEPSRELPEKHVGGINVSWCNNIKFYFLLFDNLCKALCHSWLEHYPCTSDYFYSRQSGIRGFTQSPAASQDLRDILRFDRDVRKEMWQPAGCQAHSTHTPESWQPHDTSKETKAEEG